MTGTDTPSPQDAHPSNFERYPRCPHQVNNGNGIAWHCVYPPHDGTTAADHYMVRDELAIRRTQAKSRG